MYIHIHTYLCMYLCTHIHTFYQTGARSRVGRDLLHSNSVHHQCNQICYIPKLNYKIIQNYPGLSENRKTKSQEKQKPSVHLRDTADQEACLVTFQLHSTSIIKCPVFCKWSKSSCYSVNLAKIILQQTHNLLVIFRWQWSSSRVSSSACCIYFILERI